MPILELTDIGKRFGPTVALDGVDFALEKGDVHALVGENGAGKSTLMNVLTGSVAPDRGEMRVAGAPYRPSSPHDARLAGIALIHQELSLFPHLTVSENVLAGVEPSRFGWLDRGAARRATAEVLRVFDHPEIDPDRRVADLPIAARQVVEICRAIATNARIVLMDEPTSSLQRDDVDRLFGVIRLLRDRGVSVVYISHFLEEVREIADTFTVLRDGRSVAGGSLADVANEGLIAHMVGRSVERLFPPRTYEGRGEVALEVRDLSAPPGVEHASFELRRGEILGIAGLMGSGRSEMVRALFGLAPARSGTIVAGGRELSTRSATPSSRIGRGFGYLSEDRKGEGLAIAMSVADNVTVTRFDACSARWGWIDLDRQETQTAGWIARLGIKARSPRHPVRTLSGGNQQKVALARLLHQDADVLLLDEPTRGIDIGSKAQIYETIAGCAADGKAVLMTSSYLPELFGLCDRLAVMSRRRLSTTRPTAEWTPESVLSAALGETKSVEG
jgi:ribose transport system ATP-binding protein